MATLPSPEQIAGHPRLSDDARALGESALADTLDEAARLLGLLGPALDALSSAHDAVVARALAHQVNHLTAREPSTAVFKSESIGGVVSQTARDDIPLLAPLAVAALHGIGWLLPGESLPPVASTGLLPITRSLR